MFTATDLTIGQTYTRTTEHEGREFTFTFTITQLGPKQVTFDALCIIAGVDGPVRERKMSRQQFTSWVNGERTSHRMMGTQEAGEPWTLVVPAAPAADDEPELTEEQINLITIERLQARVTELDADVAAAKAVRDAAEQALLDIAAGTTGKINGCEATKLGYKVLGASNKLARAQDDLDGLRKLLLATRMRLTKLSERCLRCGAYLIGSEQRGHICNDCLNKAAAENACQPVATEESPAVAYLRATAPKAPAGASKLEGLLVRYGAAIAAVGGQRDDAYAERVR